MNTAKAIEIVKKARLNITSGDVYGELGELLDALEDQQAFVEIDKNTRGYLREVVRTCDAVFEVLANEHLSEKTKAQALADGRSLIASVKADGMI